MCDINTLYVRNCCQKDSFRIDEEPQYNGLTKLNIQDQDISVTFIKMKHRIIYDRCGNVEQMWKP